MDDKTRRKRSYAAGYLLSLAGKPLPLSTKREPVAYLYNGVRLPKLPEWDRERYPFALWVESTKSTTYGLYVFPSVPIMLSNGNLRVSAEGFVSPYYVFANGAWKEPREYTSNDGTARFTNNIFWVSHDLLNEDGSVYLQGTAPIPVYE